MVFTWLVSHIAPIFLVTSPVTSYTDQIISIHRSRTSAGFSLDIPLIMLLASVLKIFYWIGARYDSALFIQAMVMIVMQLLLLHFALTHRPPLIIQHTPFSDAAARIGSIFEDRPYQFWQWRDSKPYWRFLMYFTVSLCCLQVVMSQNEGIFLTWTSFLGYLALTIEAILPIPQIIANHRQRGCKGFRLSVLGNWLIGDAFKMVFFFVKDSSDVPWAFKLCGLFQASCDIFLGIQYYMFGDGEIPTLGSNGDMKAKMSMDVGESTEGKQNGTYEVEMDRWQSSGKA